jgi:hypothetical protein
MVEKLYVTYNQVCTRVRCWCHQNVWARTKYIRVPWDCRHDCFICGKMQK